MASVTGGQTRQRIRVYSPNVTGGGGGTSTPVVGPWGPDFGEAAGSDGVTTRVGINVTNPTNTLAAEKIVGINATNPANAMTFDPATVGRVGIHVGGSVLGAPFWQSEAHNAATVGGTTSLVVNKPSGTVDGDLLIALVGATNVAANPSPDATVPSGWTLIKKTTLIGSTNRHSCTSFWRIASGEPSTYTLSYVNASNATAEIHRFIGTDATTPINASTDGTLLSTALVPDPVNVSVTTTAANCLVLAWLYHDHLALSQTHTPPASNIEETDYQSTGVTITGSTLDLRVFAATGATGTVTHDCTETVSTDAIFQRIAIAPGAVTI